MRAARRSRSRRPAPATDRNAVCQPRLNARAGRSAPASAAPTGTPVCLIENVSAIRDGGAVVRASDMRRRRRDRSVTESPMTTGATKSSGSSASGRAAYPTTIARPAAQQQHGNLRHAYRAVALDEPAGGEARGHRARVDEADENADRAWARYRDRGRFPVRAPTVAVAASDVNTCIASVIASAKAVGTRARMTPSPAACAHRVSATMRDSVTIASTATSCGAAGTRSTIWMLECAGDSRGARRQQRQQAIIVAAAVAEPPADEIERDAGNQHELDRVATNLRLRSAAAPGCSDGRRRRRDPDRAIA